MKLLFPEIVLSDLGKIIPEELGIFTPDVTILLLVENQYKYRVFFQYLKRKLVLQTKVLSILEPIEWHLFQEDIPS